MRKLPENFTDEDMKLLKSILKPYQDNEEKINKLSVALRHSIMATIVEDIILSKKEWNLFKKFYEKNKVDYKDLDSFECLDPNKEFEDIENRKLFTELTRNIYKNHLDSHDRVTRFALTATILDELVFVKEYEDFVYFVELINFK